MQILSINNPVGGALLYANRGPVMDLYDVKLFEQLLEEAKQVAQARNGFLLRMDPAVAYDPVLVADLRKLDLVVKSTEVEDKHAFTNPPLTMILHFNNRSFEEILAGFSSRFRGKLNKSYRGGLTTRFVSAADPQIGDAYDTFYDLYKVTGERQGFGIRPKDYYARILEGFKDCAYIVITQSAEGQPLASTLLVNYGEKSMYLFAASGNEMRNLNPSVQLNIECVKFALEQGKTHYDMGGLWSFDMEDGLYRFKRDICSEAGAREYLGELDLVFDKEKYAQFIS